MRHLYLGGFCFGGIATLLNALSAASSVSSASALRAASMNRLDCSGSSGLGGCFFDMPPNVASSNVNSSCAGSDDRLARPELDRFGRLRWPLATSCFVSQALTLHTFDDQYGTLHVIGA
jgi:hypothetical protein